MKTYNCEYDFVIDYDFVDKNNKLTNKGFLKYLCDAGSKHSNEAGYGLNDFEKTHLVWLVLNWKIEIYRRPKTDEKIHLITWSSGAEKVCSYRDYKMFDEQNNLIAIATSKWALFDLVKGSLAKVTKEITDAYNTREDRVFDENNFKLVEPNSEVLNEYLYKIMRRDIDTNKHVHNTNYLDIANEVLPEDIYENVDFKHVEVMYKHQALLGDTLKVSYFKSEYEHIIVIKNSTNGKLNCIIKLS